MAKILIAPLGATNQNSRERGYRKANYRFEDSKKEYETSFVASALANHLEIDKIYFVGTKKSMWEEVYRYFSENNKNGNNFEEEKWLEIASFIEEESNERDVLNYVSETVDSYLKSNNNDVECGSEYFLIDYGLNPKELWNNFDIFMGIQERIEDGDELYLDISHSFRSIPLFMYLMLDFIQTLNMKTVKLSGIYYGMFEATAEKGYTPLVDLSPLFKIANLTKATYNFTNFGNGFAFSDLVENPELRKTMENVSELVSLNYLVDLKNQFKKLNKLINDKYGKEDLGLYYYMTPKINSFIKRFEGIETHFEFQLEFAKWYFENKNFSNGYISLLESIITGLCEIYGVSSEDRENREKMKKLLNVPKYKNKVKEFKDFSNKVYKSTNKIRINIAHSAHNDTYNNSFKSVVQNANNKYEQTKKFFKSEVAKTLPEKIPFESL